MRYTVDRTRTVYRGRVFDLNVKNVQLSGGRKMKVDIVDHPGAVAIVPLLPNGRIILLRQLRVATGGTLHEIPAGTREPGERSQTTARRELIEETGYRPKTLRKIAQFFTAPGFCNEWMEIYLAKGLTPAQGHQDEDERIEVISVSPQRAKSMIRDGKICDAKSIIGLQQSGVLR